MDPTRAAGVPLRRLRPIFVLGAPGAGEQSLADALAQAPDVYAVDPSNGDVVDQLAALHPGSGGWRSGRLTAADVTADVVADLNARFLAVARDRDDRRPLADGGPMTLLDSSRAHPLRVPFLAAAYPDARFVFLHREPALALPDAVAVWAAQRKVSYPKLVGWPGLGWTYALVPDRRSLLSMDLDELVATQWDAITSTMLDDLEALQPDRWCVVDRSRLESDPEASLNRILGFLQLTADRNIAPPYRASAAPANDTRAIELLDLVGATNRRAHDLFAPVDGHRADQPRNQSADFASSFTVTFPELLVEHQASLLVSTYRSNLLIACRAKGQSLNTHLRPSPGPMGIATAGNRLAVGTDRRVNVYRNHADAAKQLSGPDSYDGCFLPLHTHVTGDIRIHDLAYAGDELWAVSARFSCLVTFDDEHSFVPRWRPPFVTELVAEDRCHLNGLAVKDACVSYVTALGRTNTAGGWRDGKGSGGIVMDVRSGEVVAAGLSMPHSPRWYDDRLWVLESGNGSLGVVDRDSGRVDTVIELPGFTRGLAFLGRYAFVGLSHARESVFRGLPIMARGDRECGVWAINIDTATIAGCLRFTGAVNEIFDVAALPGFSWPEIGDGDGELLDRSFVLPQPQPPPPPPPPPGPAPAM